MSSTPPPASGDSAASLTPERRDADGPSRREFLRGAAAGVVAGSVAVTGCAQGGSESAGSPGPFRSGWPHGVTRPWAGPAFWTNPLQDWRVSDGRLEMIGGGGGRNVHLLTRDLGGAAAPFETSVRVGAPELIPNGGAGFEIGIQGPLRDYRNHVVHGSGLQAGIATDGTLFIGDRASSSLGRDIDPTDGLDLRLSGSPVEGSESPSGDPTGSAVSLTLTARPPGSEEELASVTTELDAGEIEAGVLAGNLALFGDFSGDQTPDRGRVRVWFEDWRVSGPAVRAHPERAFGPVLWTQHALSRGVLKMTAQMPPLGPDEERTVRLQLRDGDAWSTLAERPIEPTARTAVFRVENWDASTETPYRVAYRLSGPDGEPREHYYEGVIRREPSDRAELVVGGLSCQTDPGFPHTRVSEGVAHHDPDVIAFLGDQFYEGSGGYGVVRDADAPIELSSLDYLRKWYLHGWAFGDLMRDRPTICMPDDHDVYQGNVWGEGGRDIGGYDEHNEGGYYMPARWVNLVQRTQTSHLPDPYDPRPVRQGISVYYTEMRYGRVSFAIVEDRKWKSGPAGVTPPIPGRPDHVQDPEFDVAQLDVEAAELLGRRQLSFLEDWAADWRHTDQKVVVSQTPFAQVPTHHGGDYMYLVSDLDSNSWPQTPRNQALRRIRKAHAYHLCGDQHLPMVLQYGVDDWEDAGSAFAVPAVCTGYPRWFHPREPLANSPADRPDHIGRYLDGLGNRVTVRAVANPVDTPFPDDLMDRIAGKSSGYGVLRIDKQNQTITAESWPVRSDPSDPDDQFDGWPQTVDVAENYGRAPAARLPELRFTNLENPMIQVVEDATGEVVYTRRVRGTSFRPEVFEEGLYAVRVGDDAEWTHTFEKVETVASDSDATIEVRG